MKRLTSFTKLATGEGIRISYTYSDIGENGDIVSRNNRKNFVVVDKEVQSHIEAIEHFIAINHLEA